jgi:molybdopterin molybdotransferase
LHGSVVLATMTNEHSAAKDRMSQSALLTIDAAVARLLDAADTVTGSEEIPLDAALGRVTALPVRAPMNVPPFAASAMDGYAVAATDACFAGDPPYCIPVRGRSAAGAPANVPLADGTALRIFTGALLPPRADSIVLQENATALGDQIEIGQRPRSGAWVRPVGHDIAEGAELFPAGTRLRAFELGWLAASGVARITVSRRVRVALFSTGDELRESGAKLELGQIYESNRRVLRELLRLLPVEVLDLGIVRDDEGTIAATLETAAQRADVVLTSGGVSVGDADFVRSALDRVGRLEFWRLALKPGKPLAYGRIGSARFFGLPGNPVSTIVTFLLLVTPVLKRLSGEHVTAPHKLAAKLEHRVAHEPGRAEYQRARYRATSRGYTVTATSDQSSNRLASFRDANCLLIVPAESGDLDVGARVDVLPFGGLLD